METQQLPDLLTHAGWLRRLARALVHDDAAADDVAQNTLFEFWRHRGRDCERDPRPWLAQVARNRVRNQRREEARRLSRERASAELVSPAATTTPEDLIGDAEIHRAVARVVSTLEQPYREVVMLRYYEALTAADIARRLGVPAGTIRWRLKEGLDRVRARLDETYHDRRRWMLALGPLVPSVANGPMAGWRPPAVVIAAFGGVALSALVAIHGLRGRWTPERAADSPGSVVVARPLGPPKLTPGPASPLVVEPAAQGREASAIGTPAAALQPEAAVRTILDALTTGSYPRFAALAGGLLRDAVDDKVFAFFAKHPGRELRGGFDIEPLGTLQQDGALVHLWKVTMTDDEADDLLVRVVLTNGRVTLFSIE